MIKLHNEMYDTIKGEYIDLMIKKIEKNYHKLEFSVSSIYFSKISVKDFFETDGQFDYKKVRKILLFDFDNSREDILSKYLKTAQIIYFSDFKVDHILKSRDKEINNKNRKDYRREYVNKYKNSWINKYITNQQIFDNNDEFQKFIKCIKNDFEKFNESIGKIIKYDYINSDLRHKIITSSNVTVCPYCNRQYISIYDDENKRKTTADLDHFYPKSCFPLFALSLYNFIPSCQMCNQRFKRDKVKKIIYPFSNEFGNDAIFTTKVQNVDGFYGNAEYIYLDITLKDNSNIKDEIENSIELFHLKELYKSHKKYVVDMLFKKNVMYTEKYFDMMRDTFKFLNLSKSQINEQLYGFDEDTNIIDDDKPLGKLTRDIIYKEK